MLGNPTTPPPMTNRDAQQFDFSCVHRPIVYLEIRFGRWAKLKLYVVNTEYSVFIYRERITTTHPNGETVQSLPRRALPPQPFVVIASASPRSSQNAATTFGGRGFAGLPSRLHLAALLLGTTPRRLSRDRHSRPAESLLPRSQDNIEPQQALCFRSRGTQ